MELEGGRLGKGSKERKGNGYWEGRKTDNRRIKLQWLLNDLMLLQNSEGLYGDMERSIISFMTRHYRTQHPCAQLRMPSAGQHDLRIRTRAIRIITATQRITPRPSPPSCSSPTIISTTSPLHLCPQCPALFFTLHPVRCLAAPTPTHSNDSSPTTATTTGF